MSDFVVGFLISRAVTSLNNVCETTEARSASNVIFFLIYLIAKVTTSKFSNKKNILFIKMPLVAKIGPSILNADLSDLASESQRLLDNGADYLHLDVMDGHFVPNLTFGHSLVKCLRRKIKDTPFETHMMVTNPQQWIQNMADAGVNLYTFHVEPVCQSDIPEICRLIQEAGMKVGLAVKPGTRVETVQQYIDLADVVLVMTVEPGFGGQAFMRDMMPKVQWLREHYPNLNIEVDGGVGPETIEYCAKAGANMIVSGTALIEANNQKEVINLLRSMVQTYSKPNKNL